MTIEQRVLEQREAHGLPTSPVLNHRPGCTPPAQQIMAGSRPPLWNPRDLTPEQKLARDAEHARRYAEREAQEAEARDRAWQQSCASAISTWRSTFLPLAVRHAEEHPEWRWPERTYERVVDALEAKRSVVLLGSTGPGKTTIAAFACRHLAATRATTCKYWTAADLVSDFRFTCWGARSMSENAYLQSAAYADVMVIDEFDERRESADETSFLTRLIDRRYSCEKPVLCVSNLTLPMFRDSISPKVADRLRETADIIQCGWPSFRTKAQAEREKVCQ